MKFDNLHATRVKNGWEFRIYSGDRYFTTFLSEEDAYRVSGFIQEVNRYRKEWDESRKSVNEFRVQKADEEKTVFISREELLDPTTADVVNVRTLQDMQDVWLESKKETE